MAWLMVRNGRPATIPPSSRRVRARALRRHCERSEAIQGPWKDRGRGPWIASLALAMTEDGTTSPHEQRRMRPVACRANHLAYAKPCLPPCLKIYRFAIPPNHTYDFRRPVPLRGVSRSSRTLVRDAMDAMCHETSDAVADGEIVWSWRPDAGAKFLRRAMRASGMTVANKPGHRGDHV